MSLNIDENLIREIISQIKDPDLNLSLKELDSIIKIEPDVKSCIIELELIPPVDFIRPIVWKECRDKLTETYPDIDFLIIINEKQFPIQQRPVLKDVKYIIAVAAGKGGVGKSAIACNIAAGLASVGAKVGLLDADIYGPSIPTMFGLENGELAGRERSDGRVLADPLEKYGVKLASMGFIMNREDAAIIRGPMLASYFNMLVEQIDWGHLDYLIVDLPPGTGDIQLTMTQKIPLTGAVIITTPQEIALSDVRRAIAMFNKVDVNVLGIIENMSWFTPSDMPDKKYFIFGEGGGSRISKEYGVKFLGEIPIDINMRKLGDVGSPIVLDETSGEQRRIILEIISGLTKEIRLQNYNHQSVTSLEINI